MLCLVICSLIVLFIETPAAHAEAVPGGNISNPVVRAVDIAKPAIVRIITTMNGRLTVHFNDQLSATFPLGGGSYALKLSGSGAFISANGDILTADHVIRPPHDKSTDQYLQDLAAQDVADYVNTNLHPTTLYTQDDAIADLNYGIFRSDSSYDQPKSEVYLSQDYTGAYNATRISNIPATAHAAVDRIERESPVNQKDVAIIHVTMTDTPSIQLGDSSNVAQQDELTIIGFPGNGDLNDMEKADPDIFFSSSVNKIYVSAIKQGPNGQPLIQVGGNVEHGDSGGPALDSQGHVVGVVSFFSNNEPPIGTSFLQASNSAQELITGLSIDTTPGTFEKEWQHAFALYTSTQPGHWHSAQQAFQKLATDYPKFQAVTPFVTYTNQQSQHEQLPDATPNQSNILPILLIIVGVIALLILLGVLFFALKDRKRMLQTSYQTANVTTPQTTLPAGYNPTSMAYTTPAPNQHYSPYATPNNTTSPFAPYQPDNTYNPFAQPKTDEAYSPFAQPKTDEAYSPFAPPQPESSVHPATTSSGQLNSLQAEGAVPITLPVTEEKTVVPSLEELPQTPQPDPIAPSEVASKETPANDEVAPISLPPTNHATETEEKPEVVAQQEEVEEPRATVEIPEPELSPNETLISEQPIQQAKVEAESNNPLHQPGFAILNGIEIPDATDKTPTAKLKRV
jgi:hypothetical protein